MAWVPLESNPDVMNKFLVRMGVPEKWQIVDVFGLDPDLVAVIPRPVVAFILLFPCSQTYKKLKAEQETELKNKGQTISDQVYYLKQVVKNACGTIALIHSVANNQEEIQLGDGCLKQFLDDTKSMTPAERGDMLLKNEAIADVHKEIAVEGQTEAPAENEPVNHHFVAFVHKEGSLYELDGSKAFPINHGPTTTETFVETFLSSLAGMKSRMHFDRLSSSAVPALLFSAGRTIDTRLRLYPAGEGRKDAAKILQEIIKKDPSEVRYTVCALSAGEV